MTGGNYIISSNEQSMYTASDTSAWLFNIGLILITIPILNFIVYPLLRDYTPNMQKRIGLGYVLAIMSPLVLLIITVVGHIQLAESGVDTSRSCLFVQDSHIHLPINSWLTLLPHLLVSFAEVFAMISSELYA